jgi:hypothetical protein
MDVSELFRGKIKPSVQYPAFNKAVIPKMSRLLTDYDLMIQGGFRPDGGLGLSNEKSNNRNS